MTKRILFVFGTRPEAIKMAPLIKAFQSWNDFEINICITAQHREMLDQVLSFFDIKPNYDLDLMTPNQTLNELAGKIFKNIDPILKESMPDIVFVHGDTLTSSICSWAAFHRGIKVAHIEAGLRTYNKKSPFPEEINRQITGRIADYHFAPTILAKQNLLNEGVDSKSILVTGNTVIDALQSGLDKINTGYSGIDLTLVKNLADESKKIILITGHRRENFGEGFEDLCQAIKRIASRPDVQIIYPVHLNPNVQEPVNRILGNCSNVHLISPVDYPAFIYLMSVSYLIITDSGGVQEEAPSLGKPVLVTRNTSERPEAIEAGTVRLVGTDQEKIVRETIELLDNTDYYSKMSKAHNPYGDGKACDKIVAFFVNQG
jgi:UDP-N-acetylglucosamine 2-epimerase (non-hydrolysing)